MASHLVTSIRQRACLPLRHLAAQQAGAPRPARMMARSRIALPFACLDHDRHGSTAVGGESGLLRGQPNNPVEAAVPLQSTESSPLGDLSRLLDDGIEQLLPRRHHPA